MRLAPWWFSLSFLTSIFYQKFLENSKYAPLLTLLPFQLRPCIVPPPSVQRLQSLGKSSLHRTCDTHIAPPFRSREQFLQQLRKFDESRFSPPRADNPYSNTAENASKIALYQLYNVGIPALQAL